MLSTAPRGLIAAAFLLAIVGWASSARATVIQPGDIVWWKQVPPVGAIGGASGGPFALSYSSGGPTICLSMCVELKEYLDQPLYVIEVGTTAYFGGVGLIGDPLDYETMWLYDQWQKGTLADAPAVQKAIWYSEDETTWASIGATAQSYFAQAEAAKNAGVSVGKVELIVTAYTQKNAAGQWVPTLDPNGYKGYKISQDLLVPEPGTLLLLGSGLVGLFLVSRRRREK